jgi:hypothetical protein
MWFGAVDDVDMNDVTRTLRDVHAGDCPGLVEWVGLNDRPQHASADFVGHHVAQSDAALYPCRRAEWPEKDIAKAASVTCSSFGQHRPCFR